MSYPTVVWCGHYDQRKFVGACPHCRYFPCEDLPVSVLEGLAQKGLVQSVLGKVKKGRKEMFFLVYKDKIEPFSKELDQLSEKEAHGVEVALQVKFCLEMKMTWIPEGQTPKKVNIPGAGKKQRCVLEENGKLVERTVDPAEVGDGVSKIYPVQKAFVRQFVPVKVDLDKGPGSTGRKPRGRSAAAKAPSGSRQKKKS